MNTNCDESSGVNGGFNESNDARCLASDRACSYLTQPIAASLSMLDSTPWSAL